MNIIYHKWFDIEVIHDYFIEGVCKKVALIPFSDTRTLFSNYQILMRKHENITSFYVGVNESESDTIGEELKQIGALYFQLISEDFLFHNYTEVPQAEVDQILLFRNEPGKSDLHVNDSVAKEDLVNFRQGQLRMDQWQEGDTIELKNHLGEIIRKTFLTTDQVPVDAAMPPVSLRDLNSGLYEIWVNGALFETSFFHFDATLDDRCIGIIKMQPTSIGSLQDEPPRYTIQLASRAVHFRYKIVVEHRQNVQLTPIQVYFPNQSTPRFHGPNAIELTGAQMAQAFTSSEPIKLQEQLTKRPLLTYTYQDPNASAGVGSDEMKLPNPSAEYLESFIDANGNTKLNTSTIVYV